MRYLALAMTVALYGCGESRAQKEFVEGCTQKVPSREVCTCVYENEAVSTEIRAIAEDRQADQASIKRYLNAVALATADCVREMGLSPMSR